MRPCASSGTTHWYCTKPRGPSVRFQPPNVSSRWKKVARSVIPLSSCAARKCSPLNSRADQAVNGQTGSGGARCARAGR